jgi:hypothetical protein
MWELDTSFAVFGPDAHPTQLDYRKPIPELLLHGGQESKTEVQAGEKTPPVLSSPSKVQLK